MFLEELDEKKYIKKKIKINDEKIISYVTNGEIVNEKPTIIFLHAFMTNKYLFYPQFENKILFSNYNLISFDEYGHGETTSPKNFNYWNNAEDIIKVLDKINIKNYSVVGTSQGGFIAIRMALLNPCNIENLILLGTSAFKESENFKEFSKELRKIWTVDKDFTSFLTSFGYLTDKKIMNFSKYWNKRHSNIEDFNIILDCLIYRDDLTERLKEIRCPTLIMHGTDDIIYDVKLAKELNNKLINVKKLKCIIVKNGNHYLSYSNPDTINEEMINFLKINNSINSKY